MQRCAENPKKVERRRIGRRKDSCCLASIRGAYVFFLWFQLLRAGKLFFLTPPFHLFSLNCAQPFLVFLEIFMAVGHFGECLFNNFKFSFLGSLMWFALWISCTIRLASSRRVDWYKKFKNPREWGKLELCLVDVPAKRLISIRHLAGERKILHHSLYPIRYPL